MAHKYLCDGCNAVADSFSDFTTRGHVLKTIYCPECLPKVDAFMRELDAAHGKAAKAFQAAIKRLRVKHSDGGKFVLPDGATASIPEPVTPKKKVKKTATRKKK
jgi:hypothetical protein